MAKAAKVSVAVMALACVALTSGCAYMQKRGHDAMDIIDIGLTVNDGLTPRFGLYLDFFNSLPIGYSTVDGKLLGMGNRQLGLLDYKHRSWGLLTVGQEQKGAGPFNPTDPHQARPDQMDVTERPEFDVGLAGRDGDEPPPHLQYFECDRVLHLGWIGIQATIRPFDLFDFLLGWANVDILHDDDVKKVQ